MYIEMVKLYIKAEKVYKSLSIEQQNTIYTFAKEVLLSPQKCLELIQSDQVTTEVISEIVQFDQIAYIYPVSVSNLFVNI